MRSEDVNLRRKRLFHKPKPVFDAMTEADFEAMETMANSYKDLLDSGKTCRGLVDGIRAIAEQWNFKPYDPNVKLNPGDRIYSVDRDNDIFLAMIGQTPLSEGFRLVASHLDSPCLDLKPNPLYEEDGQALFKTHYYGGVKKYQWLARPLELRGTVIKKDGTPVEIQVGADPYDPVLVISDILPHLDAEQREKTVDKAFTGEQLNAICGLRPDPEEGEDRVKFAVLSWLNEKYDITEEDFLSAELSLVPAINARDVGFDRSMIGAYGHDDRSCAFAALQAILNAENPKYTAVCALVDKEEIGSEGVCGMNSAHFDQFMQSLCRGQGVDAGVSYKNSFCLSGDVANAYDPNFAAAHDKRNNAKIGYGPCVFKYTGVRGKSGGSDAYAESMSRLRRMLQKANVPWQVGELGRVDLGGGGTVAKFVAQRNIDVVDIGVPVLNMHSPFEIIAKADLYLLIKAFSALFGEK